MALVLDTSVLIQLERRRLAPSALRAVIDEPFGISSVTVSELLVGAYRSDTNERSLRRRSYVERIIVDVPVLPFDLDAARAHARLRTHLMGLGMMIGAHDVMIAATALSVGFGLITHNVAEFARVPGLRVIPGPA